MSGYVEFEFNLPDALLTQVVDKFGGMADAQLNLNNIDQIAKDAQGVYQLYYNGNLVYIGKSDAEAGLYPRLVRHALTVESRRGLNPGNVTFKAIRIFVFAAMDLETQLINYYGRPLWNYSGFGSNDPGRNRETTNKHPLGFDSQYPIDLDIPLVFVPQGSSRIIDLLVLLKEQLPYTFRYEVAGKPTGSAYRKKPHIDYLRQVTIPNAGMTMRQILRLVLEALPAGWQATVFVSHVILYKENRAYEYGTPI